MNTTQCSICHRHKRLFKFLPPNGEAATLTDACWDCRIKNRSATSTPHLDNPGRRVYHVAGKTRTKKRCNKCKKWSPYPEGYTFRTGTISDICLECNRTKRRKAYDNNSEEKRQKKLDDWLHKRYFCGREECSGTPGKHAPERCPFRPREQPKDIFGDIS